MFKAVNRFLVGALLATSSSQAIAQSADWVVSEVRGPVAIVSAQGREAAARGTPVNPGDTVITGAGARAVLVHNKDFVTVAANSRIRIPAEMRGSGMTRFFQALGNAIFNVEKRGTPHFSVDTPYLAAVVKGTVFSVTVGAESTSLQVTEGAVEVATNDGGARELVKPGSIAMVAASDRYRLTITGDRPAVVDSPARPAAPQAAPIAPAATTGEASAPVPQNTASPKAVDRIEQVVTSKPVDLAGATNGLVTGMSPVVAVAASELTKAVRAESVATGPADGADKPAAGAGPTAAAGVDNGKAEQAKTEPAKGEPPKAEPAKPDTKQEPAKPDAKPETAKPEAKPDPAKPEPAKPEPAKPEPAKPEPAKPEPAKPEVTPDAKPETGKPEPTKPEVTPEPGKPDTGKPEVKPEPGKPDTGKPEVKPEPAKPDPGKPEVKPEPVKPEPAKPEVKPEPVKPETGKPEAKPEPVKPEPAKPEVKPEPVKPETGKPEAKPEPVKPEPAKPEVKPEPIKPETGKPEAKPETGKPEDQPQTGKPADMPDTGKPADKPATGKPDDTPKPPK